MNARALTWGWLFAAIYALVLSSCSFDTAVLDARRCDDSSDCEDGFFCSQQGICQSELADIVEDRGADADVGEPDPCTDFDMDGVRGGEGCEDAIFDCNDNNRLIFEGAPENCDGFDNDCDELVDTEDDDYIEEPCPFTQGVCAGTNRACVEGNLQTCDAEDYGDDYLVTEEGNESACDNLDNDCDGDVDESIFRVCYDLSGIDADLLDAIGESADCDPTTEGDCVTLADGRMCKTGLSQCVEGVFGACPTCDETIDASCQIVPVSEETFETRCDTFDNNCDGTIDEDCNCQPGEERPCYTGDDPVDEFCGAGGLENCQPNTPCQVGRLICQEDARFGDCEDEVLPGVETCGDPGIDNDCNGDSSPSDIPVDLGPGTSVPLGTACDTEISGICSDGTWQCVGDVSGLRCIDGSDICCVPDNDPEPETCSNPGEDNNCDGTEDNVDGEGESCRVTEFNSQPIYGTCQFGTLDCEGTELVCRPSSTSDEVCDNLDSDCNDEIDDNVDTLEDADHCGACGNACSGAAGDCCEGGCVDLTANLFFCGDCDTDCTDNGSLRSPACCDSGCVDLDRSSDHCGSCGDECSGGTPDCCGEDLCVDTQTDERHCGGCDMACDAGNEQCCGGVCVPKNDAGNCGACDNGCSAPETCRSVPGSDADRECLECDDGNCSEGSTGQCWACKARSDEDYCGTEGTDCDDLDSSVPGGMTDFECCDDGPEFACVDHLNDIEHCGSCGNDCTGSDPACCGAAGCRDLDFDEAHCGACGNDCSASEQCCGGRCIALGNIDNCGACGNACDANEGCCDQSTNNFTCIDLNNGVDRNGDIDFCGSCGVSCAGAVANNLDCCSGFCTDLDDNNSHCGSCGTVCDVFSQPNGEVCCDSGGTMGCNAPSSCD